MASRILHCLTLVAVLYPLAGGADFKHQTPSRLEKFYVVDVGEYDTYPYWGADIVDVQAAAGARRSGTPVSTEQRGSVMTTRQSKVPLLWQTSRLPT
jgi:hypothetical protein